MFDNLPEIVGATTLRGTRYFCFSRGSDEVWLPVAAFAGGASKALRELARIGFAGSGSRANKLLVALARVTEFPTRPLLERSGWTGQYFALPDGTTFGPSGDAAATAVFKPSSGCCTTAGTLEGWQAGVAAPLTSQPLPMFAVMAAFVAPLLPFVGRSATLGFEIVSAAGTGKNTVLGLMGSVIGAGATASLRTVLEALVKGHGLPPGLPAIISDVDLCLAGEPAAKRLGYLKALLRSRAGVEGETGNSPVIFVSTSNSGLLAQTGAGPDLVQAAARHLISLGLPAANAHGVFKVLPKGFANGNHYAEALTQAAAANHGTAIRHFIQKLVQDRNDDEPALRQRLLMRMQEFRKRAEPDLSDGIAVRTADAFGLVYAAGELARSYALLPAGWQCGPAVLACYRSRYVASEPRSFDDILLELAHDPATIRLDAGTTPPKPAALAAAHAFIRKRENGDEVMIRPDKIGFLIPNWKAIHTRLDVKRHILCENGRHTSKRRLTKHGPGERMICFQLPSLEKSVEA